MLVPLTKERVTKVIPVATVKGLDLRRMTSNVNSNISTNYLAVVSCATNYIRRNTQHPVACLAVYAVTDESCQQTKG